MDGSGESSNGDSVGRVTKDPTQAVETSLKSITADMLLTALNGRDGSLTKANLIIDSGIHKTLLTEEQWERLQPKGVNRMLKLKESAVRLIPY